MKKIISVLMSLILVVLLVAGCSADNGAAGVEEPTAPDEPGEEPSSEAVEEPSIEEEEEVELGEEETLPGFEWEFDSPENHGVDSSLLASMHEAMENNLPYTYSAVTVRDGVIIDEYYRDGYDADTLFWVMSMSKSFTGTLIGIAIEEGLIDGVDVSIAEFFPQIDGLEDAEDKRAITIRHLLTHTSGIEWYEWSGVTHTFGDWKDSDNWVDFPLEQPMAATPGAVFNYNTANTQLLAAIVEKAVAESDLPEESAEEYAISRLFGPLGMDVQWDYDPQGVIEGGNGAHLTARDAARFGQLFLQGGEWQGQQLVPPSWVEEATGVQFARTENYGSYGYQWWVRSFGGYDGYYAMGHGGQFIFIVPELNLVTVMTSDNDLSNGDPLLNYFANYVVAACEPSGSSPGALEISFDFNRASTNASSQYAVWIEDMEGNLVRTLFVTNFTAAGGYATREESLPNWVAVANPSGGGVDGVSGPTPQTGSQSYVWDGTNEQGEVVQPGAYVCKVEGTLYWSSTVLYMGGLSWDPRRKVRSP